MDTPLHYTQTICQLFFACVDTTMNEICKTQLVSACQECDTRKVSGAYIRSHCQDPETSDVYMKLQIGLNFILYDRIEPGHMHEHIFQTCMSLAHGNSLI